MPEVLFDGANVWRMDKAQLYAARRRMGMLVVTHEMGFAREVANTMAFMDQGELIAAGPAGEFFADPGLSGRRRF